MKHPSLARGGLATALAVAAVALVPGAAVANGDGHAAKKKNKSHEAVQDFNIRRSIRQNAHQRTQLNKITNDLTDTIGGLADLKGNVEALVPVVTKALTDLQTGLEFIGGKLLTLGDAYQAVEYGATAVRIGPGGAAGALPFTVISSDIPDDGNTATAAGTIPVSVGNSPGVQVPEDLLLTPRSAIRSNEGDGAATGDPAGYVGGLMVMTCGGGPAGGGACDADPGAGTTAIPAGAVLCTAGPPPSTPIDIPGAGPQNFFLVKIQQKADRTDQSKPDASSENPVGTAVGSGALASAGGCKTGETGNTLLVNIQTQFADIPTSTSPGPKD
jgi:hypothetical protein